jgi:hypothetical protein
LKPSGSSTLFLSLLKSIRRKTSRILVVSISFILEDLFKVDIVEAKLENKIYVTGVERSVRKRLALNQKLLDWDL